MKRATATAYTPAIGGWQGYVFSRSRRATIIARTKIYPTEDDAMKRVRRLERSKR